MKPPAPVTTTRSFLDIGLGLSIEERAFIKLFKDLRGRAESPAGGRPVVWHVARRLFVCSAGASPSSRPVTRGGAKSPEKTDGSTQKTLLYRPPKPFFHRQCVVLADITPVILTYNEAANIGRSLGRLTWAGQVVIVDSGSTDETLVIAGRFPNVRTDHRPFDTHAQQWRFAVDATGIPSACLLLLHANSLVAPPLRAEVA